MVMRIHPSEGVSRKAATMVRVSRYCAGTVPDRGWLFLDPGKDMELEGDLFQECLGIPGTSGDIHADLV